VPIIHENDILTPQHFKQILVSDGIGRISSLVLQIFTKAFTHSNSKLINEAVLAIHWETLQQLGSNARALNYSKVRSVLQRAGFSTTTQKVACVIPDDLVLVSQTQHYICAEIFFTIKIINGESREITCTSRVTGSLPGSQFELDLVEKTHDYLRTIFSREVMAVIHEEPALELIWMTANPVREHLQGPNECGVYALRSFTHSMGHFCGLLPACQIGVNGAWQCASGNPIFSYSRPGVNMRWSLAACLMKNSTPEPHREHALLLNDDPSPKNNDSDQPIEDQPEQENRGKNSL